jgi:type IV secretory pathway TraG/TraD family ATPase VirD4
LSFVRPSTAFAYLVPYFAAKMSMAVAAAARAANRFLGKADREAASVMSNAQRHTHFLDSPRIARVTSRSDFHFSDLRHRITSVFL